MNRRRAFTRKIIYTAAIVVLLVPLYWLSRPAVQDAAGLHEGGVLAEMRRQQNLSQAALGEIDPSSEALKLACLGMRGVAANILWEKANTYKMKKDWAGLSAVLEQIAKIEPNFVGVWRFQAWNLSYNCSHEFDDYRQRYQWVIKGIRYLFDGMQYNAREPVLQWDTGWFISQKIGRSDEKKQFRRLFKQDDEFHGDTPHDQRDSWLVGRKWYLECERIVDTTGAKVKGLNPLIYRGDAPLNLINYAANLELDGIFGEVAKRAWRNAAAAWEAYGKIDVPTGSDTRTIRLGDREHLEEASRRLTAELDGLQPGLAAQIRQEKQAKLSPKQREALAVPPGKRTAEQQSLVTEAEAQLEVRPTEIAAKISGAKQKRALQISRELESLEEQISVHDRQRQIVNYDYWKLRTQFEQQDETIQARSLLHAADAALAEAKLVPAKQAFEEGFVQWRKVLDKFPKLRDDRNTSDDLMEVIKRYKQLLAQLDEKFPEKFVLQDIVDANKDRE